MKNIRRKKIKLLVPGKTPLIECSGLFGIQNLFMKDETKNPNHTFKDRLAYEAVRPIMELINSNQKIIKTTFGSISYGNTAYSLGYYTSALNQLAKEKIVNVVSFVPPFLKNKTFGPNTDGQFVFPKTYFRKMFHNFNSADFVEIDLTKKIYNSNDLENIARGERLVEDKFIDVTEGLDRPAYVNIIIEAIEQQLKFAPDYIIVPFGAGILCDEIIDYVKDNNLSSKVVPVSSGDPKTIAVMLYGPIWVDTKLLLKEGSALTRHKVPDKKGRIRKQYRVYHVGDNEIKNAMQILSKAKISAEASGASGFAILSQLRKIDPKFDLKKHSVLVINTGNGLLNFSKSV
ncbi:MAG: pyridoxal-phosphate dependent enzyme [Candidatus Falkowbacteria bacterium]|nr:pyridoxal-phosphate dependent enzyme [Candidatus Falkowbacteria bacterium]